MQHDRSPLIIAVILITIGTGWLLSSLEILPGINWVWILGLAVAGAAVMLIGGIDKVTIVFGPFLLISAGFSIARQAGHVTLETEVPSLVIAAGMLILISYFLPVPAPRWIRPVQPGDRSGPGVGSCP